MASASRVFGGAFVTSSSSMRRVAAALSNPVRRAVYAQLVLGVTPSAPRLDRVLADLRGAASLPHVATQSIGGDDGPRFHLDIETDDLEAEIARLQGIGATVRTRYDDYAVMADPVGLLFCLLPPVSEEFATRSRTVG